MATTVATASPRTVRPLYLLALLGAERCAPIEGRTRLVKLVFLLQKKILEELRLGFARDAYRFRPFNYGPFTEEVYDDFETLRIRGLASVEGDDEAVQRFQLTDKGRAILSNLTANQTIPPALFAEIQELKRTYGSLPLDQLIKRVYSQYPSYTGKSLIKDSIEAGP